MSILAQSESRSIARRKLEEIAVVLRAVRSPCYQGRFGAELP